MTQMSESEFYQKVDAILMQLEEAIDDSGVDIDYETAEGIMTMIFGNGTQIIINRQTPVRQIWMATRTGGYHFDYRPDSDSWHRDTDGAEFYAVLTEEVGIQAGEPVELAP